MKLLTICLILTASIATSSEFNHHSISATVVPIDPGLIYPDIGYEFFFSKNDAIGFSSGVGLINRLTYTRKIGLLCLTGSLGFVIPQHDFHQLETFTALSVEYRQPLGEHLYSRIVGSAVFFEELPYDLPLIPVIQIGFGYNF